MKVVLFCGGLGTRLREHSDTVPKALVNIGYAAAVALDEVLRPSWP
jgi:choline kinase